MEFTGERYVPSLNGQIKYEHLHRYALCVEHVAGKHVLDIACGEGYGCELLASVAESVVGVDINSEVIEYATKEYSTHKNIRFMVGSCDSVPLPDNSVDVVTSFETIEHHNKHEEMMQEIKRVLKPDGLLIISSPNRLTYSDEPKYSNQFHVKELYYDELAALLRRYFDYVEIYGQRIAIGSFIFKLKNSQANIFKAYTTDDKKVKQEVSSLNSPIYFFAICSNNSLSSKPNIDSVYIDSHDDLLKLMEIDSRQTQSELERSHSQLQETQTELERSQSQMQHIQRELIHCKTQLSMNNFNNSILNDVTTNPLEKGLLKNPVFHELDQKRLLFISRLQSAQISERMGINPWNLISNLAYELSEEPCISVIITLFNYSEYIYECLDSVYNSQIANLPGNIEVLVVDDSSIDNSANLVEEYLNQCNLPICLVKKWFNTGLADARNVGLKIARSRYVFILDADNWIQPNCLAVLYKQITSHGYASVYGEISRFDNITREEINRCSCYEWDVYKLVKQPYIDAMAMFDKEIVLKVGGYSTELIEYGWFGWEDYDLWLKLAQGNYSCKLVPKVLSSYRVHSHSMINLTNKYALNLARYLNKKFGELAKVYQNSDMMFGFLLSQIDENQKLVIENKQTQSQSQELQEAYATIAAIQSSKFWKLRNKWFMLKKFLRLAKDIDIKI